jgi:hypothetical protein
MMHLMQNNSFAPDADALQRTNLRTLTILFVPEGGALGCLCHL